MIEYNKSRTSTKAHIAYRNIFQNAILEGQKIQDLENLASFLKNVSGAKLRWMKSSPRELAFRFFGFKREGEVWALHTSKPSNLSYIVMQTWRHKSGKVVHIPA